MRTHRDDSGRRRRRLRVDAGYERFAEATRDALDIGAEGRASIAWRHDGITETAWVLFVSSNYFSMVNATTIAGQLRVQHVADGPPSVVVGERFWRRKLDAAPLAGLTLVLNNTDVSVAGVIPESFTGPAGIYSPDVWLPMDDLERFGRIGSSAEPGHALAVRDGAAAARRNGAAGADAGRRRGGDDGARMAGDAQGPARPVPDAGRRKLRASRVDDRRRDRDGHHRPGAAARVLQRGEPAAGARGRTRTRHGDPGGARRQPRPRSCGSSSPRAS